MGGHLCYEIHPHITFLLLLIQLINIICQIIYEDNPRDAHDSKSGRRRDSRFVLPAFEKRDVSANRFCLLLKK
jgi:hypothetical protein